jgi:predicted RND superfamily exporter protein
MSTAENPLETQEESTGYRFRLRDMLGFITLCALQFAIISWIGALYGVLVGLGIALILFSATFLRQVWLGTKEVIAYRDGETTEPPKFRARQQRHLMWLTSWAPPRCSRAAVC